MRIVPLPVSTHLFLFPVGEKKKRMGFMQRCGGLVSMVLWHATCGVRGVSSDSISCFFFRVAKHMETLYRNGYSYER